MRYLVTGGSGFGGCGLVKSLLDRDQKVTVVDIVAPSHADNLKEVIDHPNLNYVWKGIHDLSPKDVEGHDVVAHFAAQADVPLGFPSPIWTIWENVMGTTQVLEAVRQVGVDRFLLASSGNVFGRPLYLPIDEKHPLTPHNPYSASKACQEMVALAYYRAYDVPLVIVRNGVVIGERMRKEIFIFKWLYNILMDRPIIIEGGKQTRDPCYVEDTVNAWLLTVEAPREKVVGEVFHVSRGKEYTVEDIASECMAVVGKKVAIERQPYRPGEEGMRECFDTSKAKRILGYEPKTELPEALERTLAWIKEECVGQKASPADA
jgi:nucleoside-diphosphate-sugar epimerase